MSNYVVARAGLPIDRPASRLALRAPTLRAATALTRSARSPFGGSCSSRERCWRICCTRPRDCVSDGSISKPETLLIIAGFVRLFSQRSFMTCHLRRKTTEAPVISTRPGLPTYRAWTVGGTKPARATP
jgi:hypothetical protein